MIARWLLTAELRCLAQVIVEAPTEAAIAKIGSDEADFEESINVETRQNHRG